jgi:hypothetical protein
VRRLLAVSLVAALLAVGCSDDQEPSGNEFGAAPPPTGPINVGITPLAVTLRADGAPPREVLVQDLAVGDRSDSALTFDLAIDGVTSSRVEGNTSLDVTAVDSAGTASIDYLLGGLDVAIAAEGTPTDPIVDALDIFGELRVGPDRGVTAATVETRTSGDVPGIDGLAASLDPRLTSLLLPFPAEPVGVGARWTVQGPLPLFGATVTLTADLELVERQGGRYEVTATLSAETPTPGTGPDVTLEGIGRLAGDLDAPGIRSGSVALDGTIVIPARGVTPLPMTLEMRVRGA